MVSQGKSVDTLRLIRCGLADETYGLETTAVLNIHRAEHLRPGGDAEEPVGRLPHPQGDLAVYSLAQRLRRPSPPAEALRHIVVLDAQPQPWGLLVERVSPLTPVPARCLEPLPASLGTSAACFFRGAVKLERGLMLVLAPERLHPDAPPAPEAEPVRKEEGERRKEDPSPFILHPSSFILPRSRQLVLFSTTAPAGEKRPLSFGVSTTQVAEILEPPPLVPVPGAPADVLGLVNWRDRLVPVLDLASRLGLPASGVPEHARLLIVRGAAGASLLGFLVCPAIRVLRLPVACQPSDRGLPLEPSYLRGVVELRGETLIIPDVAALHPDPSPLSAAACLPPPG
jgi:purine-binding chemotaxis protein CheW